MDDFILLPPGRPFAEHSLTIPESGVLLAPGLSPVLIMRIRQIQFGRAVYDPSFPSDQLRWSVSSQEAGKYVRTQATRDVWENAHLHEEMPETFCLIQGDVALFVQDLVTGDWLLTKLEENHAITVDAGLYHTLWMGQGSEVHTTTGAGRSDWVGYPDELKAWGRGRKLWDSAFTV